MIECYCVECEWEGSWEELVVNSYGSHCPLCDSLDIHDISESGTDDDEEYDDDYADGYDYDDDEDEERF